jgi:hypothetical protein
MKQTNSMQYSLSISQACKKKAPLACEAQLGLTRRSFLSTSAKGFGLAALLSGLSTGWIGSVFASDAPEVSEIKFGIIALTDCSPFVIAHEKGFFKKYGITATINKGANWAAIRDALSNGAHAWRSMIPESKVREEKRSGLFAGLGSLHEAAAIRAWNGPLTEELVRNPGRFGLGQVPARLADCADKRG